MNAVPSFGRPAEQASFGPQFLRLKNAGGREDPRDQFRRGHVEARVERAARWVGYVHEFAPAGAGAAPGAQDFALVAFFNRDVAAAFQAPVDRRERDGHVEWHAGPPGQDGFGVGADLVRHFARAAYHAVAADDDEI